MLNMTKFSFRRKKGAGWKKGSGTNSAKHPKGRSGYWFLTPFSAHPKGRSGYWFLTPLSALLLSTVATLIAGNTLLAQSDAQYTQDELRRHFETTAKAYKIRSGNEVLTLNDRSLMNWKNPIRTQSQGALYVWEKNGRPYVLGSIFTFEYKGVKCRHELISISPTPLTAELYADVVWSPNRPGLDWKNDDKSMVPAESPARRLFQMRTIARRFSGTLTGRDGNETQLTLKPQPLLRYQDAGEKVIDGAVFSLAMGTDPEILLVIEANQADNSTTSYRYAAARANFLSLKLELDGQEIWQAPEQMELQRTRAGEKPWSDEPFFPMTPLQPLPPPEELR